jgi:hypothetical protein
LRSLPCRSEDFLHGVTTSPTAPGARTDPATRLRLVYDLLTSAIEQVRPTARVMLRRSWARPQAALATDVFLFA